MSAIQDEIVQALQRSAERLRLPGLPGALADELNAMAGKVYEPCVVAVVGRVKAGKSTFINALLGAREDLATVGTTETTATINYFRYGNPADPARPVRCHWRGGGYEDMPPDFLHQLQGNDEETLRRADGIAYLEYQLPLDYLRRVTLVDTPGTGAVVSQHQGRTAEYMRLYGQLRERHDRETQQIGETSDAIIYLIGAVARATDRDFLEEFGQATQGRSSASNAIGVMAKIDLSPEVMARREALSGKIAGQLKDSLNCVMPISAGLKRALDWLMADGEAGLQRLMDGLRRVPPPRLEKLLSSDEFYGDHEFDDCPLSTAERRALKGPLDWAVFTTVARLAADPERDRDAVVGELERMAGFAPLHAVLESHFLKRSELLRAYRILSDARRLVRSLRYDRLPVLREREREDSARRDRFLAFIRGAGGDPAVAQELTEWVKKATVPQVSPVAEAIDAAERALGRAYHELEGFNADFEALQTLERHSELFTDQELDTLRGLLGLYGLQTAERLPSTQPTDLDEIGRHQQHWLQVSQSGRPAARRAVAERAVARLGLILDELDDADAAGEA
ncbi:dynamin family protein [Halochromatium glycolicum]|uniref:Dynamin N-terminal domain-containing protein n=1 Tax=Halochromatium glycolicum TaxID=85075 RepID=A0AAJ0X8Y5_9GAMM|nr:dynamin family protein [Halochromatium glycolicum]MBK1704301.1 hypothetical protein [Halochromatium glycolicum]